MIFFSRNYFKKQSLKKLSQKYSLIRHKTKMYLLQIDTVYIYYMFNLCKTICEVVYA